MPLPRPVAFGIAFMLMLRVAAQPSFFKTFGGTSFDWGYGVVQTADGGYAAAGYTHSYGAGNNDLYLVKTDSIGTVMWAKCYGSTWIDEGRDLIATDDGGYAICGEAWFSTNNYDYYLVRTDSAGTILWSRLYGGNDEDKPYAMAETNDGGFIISGTSRSFPSENTVVTFIVRTDAAGDTVWSKHYNEGITTSYAQDIQSLANGNFIVAGYNWASSTGGDDPMLMEIDSAGNILWARKYDHPGAGEGVLYRVMQDDDGDLVAVGQCYDAAGQTWECYAMKTDSAGHLLWEKVYGEPGGDESFFDLKQAGHDRYAVTGNVDRFSTYMDVTLLLLDSTGDTIWTRAYGGSSIENGMAMNRTDDNGFVITGNTLSFGSGSGDLFLLKTDSAGYSGCNDIIDPGYVLYDLPSPVEINLPMISYPGGFELTPSSYTFGGCISSYVCPLSEEQQVIKSVDVSVFPDPASDDIFFEIDNPVKQGTLIILDGSGRTLSEKNVRGGDCLQTSVSDLPDGYYFFRIMSEGKLHADGKFLVLHQAK